MKLYNLFGKNCASIAGSLREENCVKIIMKANMDAKIAHFMFNMIKDNTGQWKTEDAQQMGQD